MNDILNGVKYSKKNKKFLKDRINDHKIYIKGREEEIYNFFKKSFGFKTDHKQFKARVETYFKSVVELPRKKKENNDDTE